VLQLAGELADEFRVYFHSAVGLLATGPRILWRLVTARPAQCFDAAPSLLLISQLLANKALALL
jgi:hypothetical protein